MKHNDSIYHFANCRLDVGRREFYRDGVLSNLRTKSFDMLLLLIEQRDRVVSKNELLEQVWPGRYISETTLSSCLKELRKTLGDNGRQQAVIKTIHGQGFRFIATLQDSASPQAADPMAGAADTGDAPADPVAVPEPTNTGPIETGPGSEHKKVSVLHCGLVNSAALAERLGAEAMHYLLQDLFALAQEVVTRFDGQISQWLSDGLIVLFGAPVAHEDHARRALLAAFELSQRSSCLQRQPQQQQAVVSIGLSSGSAIISTLPNNPQQCYSAFNDVIRQAATLQRRADAGCVLISPDCYQLLRADVRVQALENGDGALLAECIIEPRAGVPRRFRRHMAPLVGREQELGLLQQNLAQAAEGYGQAVAISGNPGIGKSRLLSEFRHTLHTLPDTSDVRFFQANCFPHFRGTPYYPLAEYLRSCCAILDSDSADTVQQKLHNCLQAAGLQQAEALPLLLRLLDLTHDPATLEHLSAQAQRDRTALYLQQLLLHGGHTTVIALEDMHWMDASSQAWLNGFVQQLANQPVLLITTYRPGLNPDWLALPWASQLALSQLKQAHCLRLLRSLPRAITQQNRLLALAQLSGGNPFFLEELALNAGHTEHHIPDTIQGVLAARIDQLLPGDKALLQAAAIIGLSGPLQLLESLCSSPLEPALLRLQCAELLFNSFTGGERIFTFKHALVQDVAYANQLAGQRRTMHGRIARLLQQDLPELAERRPEFLAYHYSKAECYADAVRYWQRAGRKAYGRSAYQETVDHINNGLALLGHIDNPQQRYEQELALQMTLGAAQMTTCGYGATEVEHTWMRARQLCETLQNHSALFRVLIGLSNYYWVYGNFAQAYDCNRQLLR
ncbi:MAG: AAA family ATPase, partial [Candidatus Competibacteraceae bacterium]|nr:AAA family ATPase [Candidatus Competibacteraceae bacterium]